MHNTTAVLVYCFGAYNCRDRQINDNHLIGDCRIQPDLRDKNNTLTLKF